MRKIGIIIITLLLGLSYCYSQKLYSYPKKGNSSWVSFENPTGMPGQGGQTNQEHKGHAFDKIKSGETITLLDMKGAGIIHRIWMTIDDRSPQMLRSVVIKMFWDNSEIPAVSVPLGDFFGIGLGKKVPFECALFSDPEGRSFNCNIPMPYRKGARITLTNESGKDLVHLFYDINLTRLSSLKKDMLYFHAYWSRNPRTTLMKDFEILPEIKGAGRFLGMNVSVQADSIYSGTWWGEGEVKIYLDDDSNFPSLTGTGTEDYIGTGWGLGAFAHQFQGCPIAEKNSNKWAFYRYHIPDPIFFHTKCKITIQQIGGGDYQSVKKLAENGVELIPISVDQDSSKGFVRLYEMDKIPKIESKEFPRGWVNFYRRDDYAATAYFYLNKPFSNLPLLQNIEIRTLNLEK